MNVEFHNSRLSKIADSLKVKENEISDSLRAAENVDLDTIFLKDKSLLYYQVNNDSVWLTLENKKKKILFSSGMGMVDLHYRLGYQFAKEFNKSLLFRYGCPANGPCDFALISKLTGETIQEFPQLIFGAENQLFDYLVYFSKDRTSFVFENVDTKHKFEVIHHENDFKDAITPEYDIELEQKNKIFVLHYRKQVNGKWKNFQIIVNPNDYK